MNDKDISIFSKRDTSKKPSGEKKLLTSFWAILGFDNNNVEAIKVYFAPNGSMHPLLTQDFEMAKNMLASEREKSPEATLGEFRRVPE